MVFGTKDCRLESCQGHSFVAVASRRSIRPTEVFFESPQVNVPRPRQPFRALSSCTAGRGTLGPRAQSGIGRMATDLLGVGIDSRRRKPRALGGAIAHSGGGGVERTPTDRQQETAQHRDALPEWSKGVDASSTSASSVGANPTGVIFWQGLYCDRWQEEVHRTSAGIFRGPLASLSPSPHSMCLRTLRF